MPDKHEINVFFIFTPLHALVAAAIIKQESLKNLVIVAFSEGGPKTTNYCERMFAERAEIINIKIHKNIKCISSLLKIRTLKRRYRSKKVVFHTGSLKSLYSRIFISQSSEINTFDDGYGNLVFNGYFSQDDSLSKKFLLMLLGVTSTYFNTLKKIGTHYSLYRLPNIYDKYCNTKKIVSIQSSTSNNFDFPLPTSLNKIKVLLTQPYSERHLLSIEEEISLYDLVIEKFNVDYFLPHPAEFNTKISIDKAGQLKTDLIAEDIIASIARKASVEVYAFGSTALLNLMNTKNVSCVWLTSSRIPTPPPPSNLMECIDLLDLTQ